ncbi:MAG: non-heme iron oxygenase ferredoxin subunit [Rhodospirillaceae bacterium]|nr:non-heme iron oxygenase ferredoxin subunit [Rhodospirillaceae bacterium]MDD9916960.1 non-heme iron oxygenase ferredoxin subunit [Rhodospirillaceae bacterium]MDD9925109.1 non-heme iron oxygenase ferredoxin subunit [Rhodospirillaceae bacterium]
MTDSWHYAIDADDVEEEDVMPAVVEGREIAIYRVEGAFYASVDRCTHGDAALSEGIVIDDVIECPLHQGRFCVRDGRALSPPVSEPIETFPTKVEDGKVYVQL